MNLEIIPTADNNNLIEVGKDLIKPERIDRFLAHHLTELSRSRVQALIDEGYVTVNDVLCNNKKDLIKAGDLIQLITPDATPLDIVAQKIPLDVLYEDKGLNGFIDPS
jgi:23S rRNA pseudouridine1911/1915/1917 synthase